MESTDRPVILKMIGCHRCDAEAGVRIGREFLCGSCAIEDLRTDMEPPVVLCDACQHESTLRLDERFLCGRCALALLCLDADAEPDLLRGFASALSSAKLGQREPMLDWAWEIAGLTRERKLTIADASAMYHRVLIDAIGAEAGSEQAVRWMEVASMLFGAYAASVDGYVTGLIDRMSVLDSELEGTKRFAEQLGRERDEGALRLRRAKKERASLVRSLTRAKEEERNRIAEEIHDDTIQTLVAVRMRLQAVGRSAAEPADVMRELARLTAAAIGRLRRLAFDLRSDLLDRYGLACTLRELLGQTEEHFGVRFRLDDRLGYEPAADVRANVYRIAQEAIANVRKHAQAENVQVGLEDRDGGVLVTIRDDGAGFETQPVVPTDHAGMRFMADRAERAGGWLEVASAIGTGTEVTCWIPNRIDRSIGVA